MPLPDSFKGSPQEDLHHHFCTASKELRKTIKGTQDKAELEIAFARYLNIIKHLDWHRKNSEVYRKDAGEKASKKLIREFNLYLAALNTDQEKASQQSLLESISEIEQLVEVIGAT